MLPTYLRLRAELLSRRSQFEGKLPDDDTRALLLAANGHRLTTAGVQFLIRDRAHHLWPGRKVTSTVLRATCARDLLDAGADEGEVAALLGLSKVAGVRQYRKIAVQRLRQVHAECHPHGGVIEIQEAIEHETPA